MSDKIETPARPESGLVPGSLVVSREKLMEIEANLMKAAAEFGKAWGCDQREHPRMYWLELHLSRWSDLARCALAYAECFNDEPADQDERTVMKP